MKKIVFAWLLCKDRTYAERSISKLYSCSLFICVKEQLTMILEDVKVPILSLYYMAMHVLP